MPPRGFFESLREYTSVYSLKLVKKARLQRSFSPETVGTVCAEGANSPPDRVLRTAKPYGAICRPQVSRSIRIQSEGL